MELVEVEMEVEEVKAVIVVVEVVVLVVAVLNSAKINLNVMITHFCLLLLSKGYFPLGHKEHLHVGISKFSSFSEDKFINFPAKSPKSNAENRQQAKNDLSGNIPSDYF